MYENLLKTVTNIGSPRVMVIGDFMLDIYIYGDALRISPEAPVPVLRIRNKEYGCGGAGSVVADLVKLGAKSICVGIIGQDENGKILADILKKNGADTTGLLQSKKRPTTSKQRLIGLAQHRHQQQLFRMDEELTDLLTDQKNNEILALYKERLPQVDIVCLQDHDKGLLSKSLCRQIIKTAKQADIKVIVDPCLTSDYTKYAGATVITPNRQETTNAVGYELEDENDFAQAVEELIKKLKLEAVVITLDKLGAYLGTNKSGRLIPTKPRNVYDVTGAGDMVLATIATTLASKYDYETAVELSNIAGGLEVEKFGCVPISIEEIIDEILSQKRNNSSKLHTVDSLTEELSWHRRRNKTLVFTNGCFDVIHTGHIEYLKFCKQQGDILIVGLNSDKSVKSIKGPDRPINNQIDRATVLASLEIIDYITIFDEPDPLNLIKKVKPDVLIKGQDWQDKGVIGQEFVESIGGKVLLAPIVKGKSSTAIIEKIKPLQD